ncbi:MAG: protein kinase [Blastocatellia bacterium]|nr:protein kinase [Blastocatellia bacterium]
MPPKVLPPGTELNHYRLLSHLGGGGMGEVYLAEDTRLERKVALKILPAEVAADPQRMQRFQQEARATSALTHPHILTVFEIGQTAELHFIATEFIEGATLRAYAATQPPGVPDVLEIGVQVAAALCAAHQSGIVHRDIKPENIMIRPDGYVKVLDFGLAKLTAAGCTAVATEAATVIKAQTLPGMVLGTTSYMSPEQARGLEVDGRSDVWSLGVVLYELTTAQLPFQGTTVMDVLGAILYQDPPLLSALRPEAPAEFERIIGKALAKDRGERYQTIKDFQIDLKRLKQRLDFGAELEQTAVPESGMSGPVLLELVRDSSDQTKIINTGPLRKRIRKQVDSLAVLPFENGSTDPDAEYLSDGLTERLINQFSQLPKLRVMARSTVFRYKGQSLDPMEIGCQLNVRAVLTGRVLLRSHRLILKLELVDVADGAQLWGEQYSRNFEDIFAIEEEMANEIAEKLRLKLTGEEKKKLTRRCTENTEAYQLYLKGRYFCNKRTQIWLRKGIECFQQAIDLDPNYALAYAGLADAYGFLGSSTGGQPPNETYPIAKAAAGKALELDPKLAEAHSSLGFFHLLHDWDWAAAETAFKRALEANPGYATAHDGYGFWCKVTGRLDEAIAACERAQRLDPLSLFMNVSLAWAYYFARRYDDAVRQNQKVLEMDPNFSFAYWNLGAAYEQKRHFEAARDAFRKAVALSNEELTFLAGLGRTHALLGDQTEARALLARLTECSRTRYVPSYYFSIIHLGLGETEAALEWLEKAYVERSGFLAFLKVEPMFDPLRSEARFKELLTKVGLS